MLSAMAVMMPTRSRTAPGSSLSPARPEVSMVLRVGSQIRARTAIEARNERTGMSVPMVYQLSYQGYKLGSHVRKR